MRRFEWDEEKANSNFRKHGITFERATEVFSDPFLIETKDSTTDEEERWIITGMTKNLCLLLVVVCTLRDKAGHEVIRIISARRAEKQEMKLYEHG